MLESKAWLILLYLGLLTGVCAWPFILLLRRNTQRGDWAAQAASVALLLGAVALLVARGAPSSWSPLALSWVLVLPLVRLGFVPTMAGLATLPLLAGVTWWAPTLTLSPLRSLAFVALGLAAAALPRLWQGQPGLPPMPTLLVLALLGLAATLLTGVYDTPVAFGALWHHWGAFVSPPAAMLGGGVPFRDFPVQYGMGPTLLIGLLSRGDYWAGTYLAASLSNILYLLLLGGCALIATRDLPRGAAALALTALTSAVLLWTGYPPDLIGSLMSPSVVGLRFLPLAALLLHILWCEMADRPRDVQGHVLWFIGLAWSPEAAFFVSAVWWPYLTLRRAEGLDGGRSVLRAVLTGIARALAALVMGAAALVMIFRLGFGDWPSPSGFLTYALNPPGVMPANLLGPIWLMLAAVAAGILALARADRNVRSGFACLMAFVAVGSYYLGRSHDNNLLNLFPFLVLALLQLLPPAMPTVLRGFAMTVLAALVAWTASFGIESWTAAWSAGRAATLGPARLLENMRLALPDAQELGDTSLRMAVGAGAAPLSDAGAALAWLRQTRAGTPLLVNAARVMVRDVPGPVWTGMNNLANYALLPPEVIEHFIRRGAAVYNRPGWILVDRLQPEPWLDRFRVAYDVGEERVFGDYVAYRLVPR